MGPVHPLPARLALCPDERARSLRPGASSRVVDIDEGDHQRLVTQWHTQLRDPDYVADFIARTTQWHRDTEHALDRVDQAIDRGDGAAAHQHLEAATAVFLGVMSTHIVNWLLPEDDWNTQLAHLFADTRPAADCLLALMTPSTTGHLPGPLLLDCG